MTPRIIFGALIGLIVFAAGIDQLAQGHTIVGALTLAMAAVQFATMFMPKKTLYDLGVRHAEIAQQDNNVGERKTQR